MTYHSWYVDRASGAAKRSSQREYRGAWEARGCPGREYGGDSLSRMSGQIEMLPRGLRDQRPDPVGLEMTERVLGAPAEIPVREEWRLRTWRNALTIPPSSAMSGLRSLLLPINRTTAARRSG